MAEALDGKAFQGTVWEHNCSGYLVEKHIIAVSENILACAMREHNLTRSELSDASTRNKEQDIVGGPIRIHSKRTVRPPPKPAAPLPDLSELIHDLRTRPPEEKAWGRRIQSSGG